MEYREEVDNDDERYIRLENMYYQCKSLKQDGDIDGAIKGMEGIVGVVGDIGGRIWKFKAMRQLARMEMMRGNVSRCLEYYEGWLAMRGVVSKREFEKRLLGWLDWVAVQAGLDDGKASDTLLPEWIIEMGQHTLRLGQDCGENVIFRVHVIIASVALRRGDLKGLYKEIQILRGLCKEEKNSQWLELCSLEIQYYDMIKDDIHVRSCYYQALKIKSLIPHPRRLAKIRQIGGKMHMRQANWSGAKSDFFESFRLYDEISSPERIKCLQYAVVANMLVMSEIDLFDAPEMQPYRNHPDIMILDQIARANREDQVILLEQTWKRYQEIIKDEFLGEFITPILYASRSRILTAWLQELRETPSSCREGIFVSFEKISMDTGICIDVIEDLLFSCIMESKIKQVVLDQQRQGCVIYPIPGPKDEEFKLLEESLVTSFMSIHSAIRQALSGVLTQDVPQ